MLIKMLNTRQLIFMFKKTQTTFQSNDDNIPTDIYAMDG